LDNSRGRKYYFFDKRKSFYRQNLPEGFKIRIIENNPGVDQTYVLPAFTGEELFDEQLDNIAGGSSRGNCDDLIGFGNGFL